MRKQAGQPDDQEGGNRMQDPDRRCAPANDREDDREEDQGGQPKGEQDSPSSEPCPEREEEEQEAPQEDEVPERNVRAEAVVELLVGDRVVGVRLLVGRERAVSRPRRPARSPQGRARLPRTGREHGTQRS